MKNAQEKRSDKKSIRKARESGSGAEPVLTPKQREAEKLYLKGENKSQIARLIGVSRHSINRWEKKFQWKTIRSHLERTPQYIESILLLKLSEELENIKKKKGLSGKDADNIAKISSAIKTLRRDSDKFGDIVQATGDLLDYLKEYHPKFATDLTNIMPEFTERMLKKYSR